jgi:hypothetical protein
VTRPVKLAAPAATRLAAYGAHGLDITGPFRIDSPGTSRLRNIAWLAHRTLPCALSPAGEAPAAGSLTAPDGATLRAFGPDDAESEISGTVAASCRWPPNVSTRAPGRKRPVRTALLLFASSDLRVTGGSAGALTVRRG